MKAYRVEVFLNDKEVKRAEFSAEPGQAKELAAILNMSAWGHSFSVDVRELPGEEKPDVAP